MDSEKLKYFLEADLRPRFHQHLPKVIIDLITMEELCEEVWLSGDKADADSVLSAYADTLSDYNFILLCEVLFGPDIVLELEEEKSSIVKKLHHYLDRILF